MTEAADLDNADPLAFTRDRFRMPQGVIYLDGNSLGALPAETVEKIVKTVELQWGNDLIASWNKHSWIEWPLSIARKLAPIVGASADELMIGDSTSVSLFKLLAAAVRARPGRRTILTTNGNFPTDLYVASSVADLLGVELKIVEPAQIASSIDEHTAVVTLTHVDYRTAALFDMSWVNGLARRAGALTLWDLSHTAGALEISLDRDGADLAVGCGYKYLNGGPGAPAFMFVAEHLQGSLSNPIRGWMGHADPFAFANEYAPAPGLSRFSTGTPSIIALAALEGGLETFQGIDMKMLSAKSRTLSQLFIQEVANRCGDQVSLGSPGDPEKRGSHVVFAHPHGYAVMQALIARSVIGDFRAPNLLRFGFAPLYNTHAEMVLAATVLADVLTSREWDQPRFKQRARVT